MLIAINSAVLISRLAPAQTLEVQFRGDLLPDQCVEPRFTAEACIGARRCGDRFPRGRTPIASAGCLPPAGYA